MCLSKFLKVDFELVVRESLASGRLCPSEVFTDLEQAGSWPTDLDKTH